MEDLATKVVFATPSELAILIPYGEYVKRLKLSSTANDVVKDQTLVFLRYFPNLTYLDLCASFDITDNGLQHLPKNLTELNLSGCRKITNACFRYLEMLPLTEISLDGCYYVNRLTTEKLRSRIPGLKVDIASDIESSTKLDLSKHLNITDADFQCLPQALIELNLSGCEQITDVGVAELAKKCPQLKVLSLAGCKGITDDGLSHLPENLAILNLDRCPKITDKGLEHLQRMKLNGLSLQDCCRITDKGIKYLENIPLLGLNLSGCERITDRGLMCLPKVLMCLSLRGTDISEDGLRYLPTTLILLDLGKNRSYSYLDYTYLLNLSKLQFLRMSNTVIGNESIKRRLAERILCDDYDNDYCCCLISSLDEEGTNESLATLASDDIMSGTELLSLRGCKKITDSALQNLPHAFTYALKTLDMSRCIQITDTGINYLRLPRLNELNLEGCSKIIGNGIESLEVMPLIRLNLGDCPCISDAVFESLPPTLVSLSLKGCLNITGMGLKHLTEQCPKLAILDLSNCHQITDTDLKCLPANLLYLNLSGCKGITTTALQYLPQSLLRLDVSGCNIPEDAVSPLLSSSDIRILGLPESEGCGIIKHLPQIIDLMGLGSEAANFIRYVGRNDHKTQTRWHDEQYMSLTNANSG